MKWQLIDTAKVQKLIDSLTILSKEKTVDELADEYGDDYRWDVSHSHDNIIYSLREAIEEFKRDQMTHSQKHEQKVRAQILMDTKAPTPTNPEDK
jgi:hypothetical protein